jgi:hypothetical protein
MPQASSAKGSDSFLVGLLGGRGCRSCGEGQDGKRLVEMGRVGMTVGDLGLGRGDPEIHGRPTYVQGGSARVKRSSLRSKKGSAGQDSEFCRI